jgi:hypothetical protein
MHVPDTRRTTREVEGIVRRVDPICRELDVHIAGTAISCDVPRDCPITLRGERVKFRLLQPQDRVRIVLTESDGSRIAEAIDVQPVR